MKLRLIIALLFFLNINTNFIFAYNDWQDNYKNYNYSSYNYNNDYNFYNNLNLNASYNSNFYIDMTKLFKQNNFYENVRQTWQMNSYDSPSSYSENVNKYVAPSVVVSDYAGNQVKENTAWESYNYQTNQYKPQSYSNVILSEEAGLGTKNPQSFDMLIGEDEWQTRNKVSDIKYGENNLVKSYTMTTADIDNNIFTQRITNIEYKENPQTECYNNLVNECAKNSERKGYYLWRELGRDLEKFDKPAKNVVSGLDMQTIDVKGEVMNIHYENIQWDNKGITGFEYKVMPDDPTSSVIPESSSVIPAKAGIYDKSKTIDPTIFADGFKGQNPLELAGASSFQIGDAKVPVLTKNYDNNGLFDVVALDDNRKSDYHPTTPVISSEEACLEARNLNSQLNITDKPTEQNRLKTQIFELSQTDEQSVKNIIWNNNLKDAKKEDLQGAVKAIEKSVNNKLDKFSTNKSTDIETASGEKLQAPDGLKLKLENNRIATNSKLTDQQGNEVKNVNFVISSNSPLKEGCPDGLRHRDGVLSSSLIPLVEGCPDGSRGGVEPSSRHHEQRALSSSLSSVIPSPSVIPAKAGIYAVLETDKSKVFTKPEIKKEPTFFERVKNSIKNFFKGDTEVKSDLANPKKTLADKWNYIKEKCNKGWESLKEGWNKIWNLKKGKSTSSKDIDLNKAGLRADKYQGQSMRIIENNLNKDMAEYKAQKNDEWKPTDKALKIAEKAIMGLERLEKEDIVQIKEVATIKEGLEAVRGKIAVENFNINSNFKDKRIGFNDKPLDIKDINVMTVKIKIEDLKMQIKANTTLNYSDEKEFITTESNYQLEILGRNSKLSLEYSDNLNGNYIYIINDNSNLSLNYKKDEFLVRYSYYN